MHKKIKTLYHRVDDDTGQVAETEIAEVLASGEFADFQPAAIIKDPGLTTPDGWTCRQSTVVSHLERNVFPWEQAHKAVAPPDALNVEAGCVA